MYLNCTDPGEKHILFDITQRELIDLLVARIETFKTHVVLPQLRTPIICYDMSELGTRSSPDSSVLFEFCFEFSCCYGLSHCKSCICTVWQVECSLSKEHLCLTHFPPSVSSFRTLPDMQHRGWLRSVDANLSRWLRRISAVMKSHKMGSKLGRLARTQIALQQNLS